MRTRRPLRRAGERRSLLGRGALAAAVAIGLAAGCGGGKSPAPSGSPAEPAGRPCGSTKTAANVPVSVRVARGHVSCGTAMAIARDYAAAVRSGRAPGNGGGGPVTINGWTCEGFPTPTVLRTGKAARCVRRGEEILEILPASG